jgi:hypothetical protein
LRVESSEFGVRSSEIENGIDIRAIPLSTEMPLKPAMQKEANEIANSNAMLGHDDCF